MIDTDRLLQISNDLGFNEIAGRIGRISLRQDAQDTPLVLPLVGEFSSGKTTLINSLTDSKALETASKPTTATIFEVHFGADKCKAVVMDDNGRSREVSDIASLKNSQLGDTPVVTVFDTSAKVPSSIVLVDTPGLSSPDPRHRQTLIDFLPQADAVLLVSDINSQLTRSLTDFVKTMSLSNRRLYLVLTKTDTKSASEVEASKKYIEDNLNISRDNIVCVSAQTGNVDELMTLLSAIQRDKAKILATVNGQRLSAIVKEMSSRIDELLKAPTDDKGYEEQSARKKAELSKIKRKIDEVIASATDEVETAQRNSSRKFEDTVSERLETLAAGKSNDFDSEAMSLINNTASLVLNEYKSEIRKSLHKMATKHLSDEDIDLGILDGIDVSGMSINGLSYNLDLNTVGHEYDGYISTGLKVAAAVGLVAATVATAGAAGAGAAAAAGTTEAAGAVGAAETAATVSTVASVADTATDVGSMVVAGKLMSRINKAGEVATKIGQKYEMVENAENTVNQKVHSSGIVKSMVGYVTDKTMGKPQRRRAIHNYMDNTLMPQFKQELQQLTTKVEEAIREAVNQGAESAMTEMNNAMSQLHDAMKTKRAEYDKRISLLRDYKNELALM